ncbi:B-zip transcription factor [Striga asiatica]|uniref:B-zip transcription factor n=1 Tax=Striga asiatica TaxID=4170 RepID=A0A5A7R5Y9_STRAF|nr:B-zip transcription factor [Striga asiatica]
MELMKGPRVESNLRVFVFKIRFNTRVTNLRKTLNIINSASEEIRNSKKLREIMKTILFLGNTSSPRSPIASPLGFKLDCLSKLTNTNAANRRMTPMQYICKILAERSPELMDFHKDLINLEASTKVHLKTLAEEMEAINKSVENTTKEFIDAAQADMSALTDLYSTAIRKADELPRYFGEDPARCPFEQVPMALPLGKLTIILGAGLVGSVLAKEGRISNVSDFFSGAFKIVFKQLKKDDSGASSSKPRNDLLVQQVNSIRQELQLLASNRSMTIVTGDRSASGKYGVLVIVVVVGYGYIWWKGWRLSDMMFATRRGLNDACSSVSKQLENATRKHLSSRIDRVDCKIDECADNAAATKEEVLELRGDVKLIGSDVESVHHVVRSLETKISRIEGRQNEMNFGVGKLVTFVRNLENSRSTEQIEGGASSSARPALELPQVSPLRVVSLPPNALPEPPSPSNKASESSRSKQAVLSPSNSTKSKVFSSGLKEFGGISEDVGISSLTECHSEETKIDTKPETVSPGVIARTFSGLGASLLTRSRSAMQSFK